MSGEKTEDPTPSRLRQLRRRGDVPVGREVLRAAAALSVPIGLWAGGRGLLESCVEAWRFDRFAQPQEVITFVQSCLAGVGGVLLAILGFGAALAMGAGAAQTGGLFAPGRLVPDGKRFMGLASMVQQWKAEAIARASLAMGIVLAVLLMGSLALGAALSNLPSAYGLAMEGRFPALLEWSSGPLLVLGIGLIALLPLHASLDVILARRAFLRRNRMSLKDIRDELKREDGDPEMRSKRDALRQDLMDEEVRREVARADVVIRNPTHIAVALRYDPLDGSAPRVLVSGKGAQARRIVRHAHRLGIPELEHRPVARALVKLPRGAEVPRSMHVAVAEILRWASGLRSVRSQRD